jgi:hypothetical protein
MRVGLHCPRFGERARKKRLEEVRHKLVRTTHVSQVRMSWPGEGTMSKVE